MTQAATSFELPADIEPPVRPPGGLRRFAGEVGDAVWMPIRLLLRHWPVLFALGVAGMVARDGLVRAAVWTAGFNGLLGFLVFLLAPVAAMAGMVLMLRAVRPSLPSVRGLARRTSVLRDLGSVLIPFVAFYVAFDLFEEDYRQYDEGLFNTYESVGAYLEKADKDVRVWGVEGGGNLVPLLSVVVVAFLLRWALDRWELTRRSPMLGIPGAYLETIWVVLGVIWVVNPLVRQAEGWAGERRAWHAVLDWWHDLVSLGSGLGQLYRTANDWLVAAFPSGGFTRTFLVPITGLVAAAVVYNLNVSTELRYLPGTGRRRWVRLAVDGVIHAISRRFGPLIAAVRAMVHSGTVPLMVFCLSVVALQTAAQWLRKAEWALIGPREIFTVQRGLDDTVEGLNDVLTFMVLVCVLAAAANGVARRTGRRGLVPDAPVPDAPVPDARVDESRVDDSVVALTTADSAGPDSVWRGSAGGEADVAGQGQTFTETGSASGGRAK